MIIRYTINSRYPGSSNTNDRTHDGKSRIYDRAGKGRSYWKYDRFRHDDGKIRYDVTGYHRISLK